MFGSEKQVWKSDFYSGLYWDFTKSQSNCSTCTSSAYTSHRKPYLQCKVFIATLKLIIYSYFSSLVLILLLLALIREIINTGNRANRQIWLETLINPVYSLFRIWLLYSQRLSLRRAKSAVSLITPGLGKLNKQWNHWLMEF